jgi:hypothetical protein
MIVNFHSMGYFFRWHFIQYSDGLWAGPFAVCFLAEARDLLSVHNIRPALGTSVLLFSGCCGSFPTIEAADA